MSSSLKWAAAICALAAAGLAGVGLSTLFGGFSGDHLVLLLSGLGALALFWAAIDIRRLTKSESDAERRRSVRRIGRERLRRRRGWTALRNALVVGVLGYAVSGLGVAVVFAVIAYVATRLGNGLASRISGEGSGQENEPPKP